MAIRGSNPVWLLDDLTGNLMDDTYYLWVLENDIPYQPATVWHDASATNEWTNPIQVLANGTLPIDIFFDSETLYRLEFRKNDGTSTPSQSDALIYLITDYSPGSAGGNNITTVSLNTDNQITNAQFSLINFTSPLSLTTVTDQVINVGPGWDLVLPGTGNVTLTKVPLNSASGNINPTNAPYALQINISNWNEGEVYLRQRFEQSGMLWAGKYVSASVTAKWISGTSRNLVGKMYNSVPTELATVLTGDASTNFIEIANNGLMPAANNTNTPPDAYVEYRLYLPSTVSIQLTSLQLIVSTQPLTFNYEQDTIQRQIDHTYNTAYPIVPVGAVIDFAGFVVPKHYLATNGAAVSRLNYALLYTTLTTTETVNLTNTVATFTVASSANYHVGMAIEGEGVAASTTISVISGTTITMSNAATATASSSVRFFAWGAGDGSTTFNVPNLNDYVTAGDGGTLFGAANNSVGLKRGSATISLVANNLPAHTHPAARGSFAESLVGGSGSTSGSSNTLVFDASTGANATTNTPLNIVQQTALMKKCIRFE